MSDNVTSNIITALTLLFGGAAWKFYVFLIKNKIETKKEKRMERTIFRDDLIERVDKLEKDKEECMASLLKISQEVSELRVKLMFIEKENERLKDRL